MRKLVKLRRFNEQGIEQFALFRAGVQNEDTHVDLESILDDPSFSSEVEGHVEVVQRQFSTRFAAGEFLHELLSTGALPNLDSDRGVWAWLSAFYFDQLCPPHGRLGDDARWVPAVGDFRKYYRHLLAGPYQILRAHRDDPKRVWAVLANPVHTPGDVAEQLASRQELITNRTVMETATRLYVVEGTGTLKPGAAAQANGSARRLVDVLNQLDLTWDLYSLTAEQLFDLLPLEFEKFKQ